MKVLYRAYDGKTFDVKKNCIEYEHANNIDDVKLYSVDYSGNFHELEPDKSSIPWASAIVIKTKLGAAWVNSFLFGKHLPSKPGTYVRDTYYGWTKWDGTMQELADKKTSYSDWMAYINYLQSWVNENAHFTNVGGSPMSYSEFLELEKTLKEARDDR